MRSWTVSHPRVYINMLTKTLAPSMSNLSLRKAWEWLALEPQHRLGTRFLQIAVGLMLLFRVATEGRFYGYLWGPSGVGTGGMTRLFGSTVGGVLDKSFATSTGTLGVLAVLALSAILLISGRVTRLATLGAFLTFFMLEQRLPELPDGGDNITRIVLIYMLFLLPPRANPKQGGLLVWFHNLAVLAIIWQIVILYTTSGIMKAYGDKWHHGVAMYYVSQVEWFSLPALRHMFMNPFVVTLSTYIPMFYQLFFAIALLSPLKLPWLLVGMIFHVGVATFMGLVSFSTVMIGLEGFLISDDEYAYLLALSRGLRQWANRKWRFRRMPAVPSAEQPEVLGAEP